jgi:hypothetical protein
MQAVVWRGYPVICWKGEFVVDAGVWGDMSKNVEYQFLLLICSNGD